MVTETIKPTVLMIKQHNITGLRYLCKTTKLNKIESYSGSGKYWLRHLKTYGNDWSNIWISEVFADKSIVEYALALSELFDVVDSDEWANFKPENGLDGGKTMDSEWYKQNRKKQIFSEASQIKKSETLLNPEGKYQKSREVLRQRVNNMTDDERKMMFAMPKEKQKIVNEKLSLSRSGKTKDTSDRVKRMSDTKKVIAESLSPEERKEKFSTTTGMKWYHNDNLKQSKFFYPHKVEDGYIIGRKKYENKEN
jgi:hypothetical protein